MSTSVRIPEKVRNASPYVAGKPIDELARELGLDPTTIVKLASNENPLGMSPRAAQAIAELDGEHVSRYPDSNGFALKSVIARHHDIDPSSIVLGNGSENLLELVAKAFVEPGVNAVSSQYAFVIFAQSVHNFGGANIVVPAKDLGNDLDAMLSAITPETVALYIANPNNPTGTFIQHDEMERFLNKVPANVLVVIDEAYTEYLPPKFRYDGIRYATQFSNVIITRTFSKVYGLAGLRVGYSVSNPEIAECINKVRTVFNVNEHAQVGAAAALQDAEFIERSYTHNRRELQRVQKAFDDLGLRYVDSVANFVLVHVGNAEAVNTKLLHAGVIVRPMGMYGLREWLRISIGTVDDNTRMLEALRTALVSVDVAE